jgi:protein-S-isoprenylcysteine O-methyltransferase Ste14
MPKNNRSRISNLLRIIVSLLVFLAILFIPAGGFDWIEGWIFFAAFIAAVGALVIWGYRTRPDLMRERAEPGDNVKDWDQVIMGVYTFLLIGMLVLAALDSGRFGWSSPPLSLAIVGWAGFALALGIVWWTFAVNPFLSEQVRIQDDRGHRVISTGPYQYVRHPMYAGIIIVVISVPLVLRSLWALILAGMIVILFVVRTIMEDRTLQEELPGYKEYSKEVRYRLVPHVW